MKKRHHIILLLCVSALTYTILKPSPLEKIRTEVIKLEHYQTFKKCNEEFTVVKTLGILYFISIDEGKLELEVEDKNLLNFLTNRETFLSSLYILMRKHGFKETIDKELPHDYMKKWYYRYQLHGRKKKVIESVTDKEIYLIHNYWQSRLTI